MPGPLNGITIIDLTTVLMGPFATQHLGDMGANVLKIEPLKGDVIRYSNQGRNHGMSNLFLNNNRNKRSIVLDLKQQEGKAVLTKLIQSGDVLVSNVRPQAMNRLGLSYEAVKKMNAEIIYVSCFGFGQNGPYAKRAAYDDIIQTMVGVPHLFERAYDEPPKFLPSNFCDRVCGLTAVNAVTTALFYRERTGKGQLIEIPMYETMVQFLMGDHLGGYTFEPPQGTMGYARIVNPNRKPYKTKDGYLAMLVYNDKHWATFLTLIGRADLVNQGIFANVSTRGANIVEVYGFVREILLQDTTATWLQRLENSDIPHTIVPTLEDILENEHLQAINFFPEYEHPSEGKIRTTAIPSQWSVSQPSLRLPPPRLGQHSQAILVEYGYSNKDIEQMVEKGITLLDAGR